LSLEWFLRACIPTCMNEFKLVEIIHKRLERVHRDRDTGTGNYEWECSKQLLRPMPRL
jgi:hypothetical protein